MMRMRGLVLFSLPAVVAVAEVDAQAVRERAGAPDIDGSATITAADLRVRIGVLAHDSMRGRDTPSPELEKVAVYVATKFRAFGLLPGVGESFQQRYPLTVVVPGPADAQSLEFRSPAGRTISLAEGDDFVAVPVGGDLEASGALVSIKIGDDQTDLLDRVAVIRATPQSIQGALGRIRELLAGRQASGAIVTVAAPENYVSGLRRFFGRRRISLGEPEEFPGPVAIVAEDRLPEPLAAALRRGDDLPAGWTASLRAGAQIRREEAMNVIGWLEGSDPDLADEFIVFTAHMDHVGVGRPVNGDSIYNGADDDASGTAAVVELAQAFAETTPGPRRSMVFMTVSGEEKGLLGSRWYSEHPIFPLDKTVANLNIDMIGRNWPDTVVAIGKAESTLGPLLEEVAAAHPELGLTLIDDPWPEERFYFRSDHFNFARSGVPILFFFTGTHEDYHRPSDEPERIEYEKTARIARLIYYLGLEIGNASGRPEWDPEAYRRVVEGGG